MKKTGKFLYQHPFLLFTLFLLLTYLPVFLPFFHLKNDLVTQNLPTRFVIGESVYSGYFPWWNPYINFGIPQYGDMNNGFWNPLLWLIARTFGYNIWTITFEEIFYILAGAWGIYKLCSEFLGKPACLSAGLAYMACGYNLGHLQHFCWITGTAFFPYVLLFFARVHRNPILKNFVLGAFATFLFLAATHPGLIIGAGYFFLFLLAFIFIHRKGICSSLYSKQFWLINLAFLAFSCLLAAVVIASNLDVLQHISRGERLSREQMLLNPTTFQSYLSMLVPLGVHTSSIFSTDISMRNIYIGLAGLIGLALFIKTQHKKTMISVGLPLLFFVLLAAGGVFKVFYAMVFPLTGFVRMNGEFSYFTSLILILCSAVGLEAFQRGEKITGFATKTISLLLWLIGIIAIASLVYIFLAPAGPGHIQWQEISSNFRMGIKEILAHLSLPYLLFAGSLLQWITLLGLKRNPASVGAFQLILLNLVLNAWLVLPYTGLGKRSQKEFDRTVNVFPRGIHAPELQSIRNTRYLDSTLLPDLWLIPSYSKKIGYREEESYPVELKSSLRLFADPETFQFITRQSYLFLHSDTTTNAKTDFDSSSIHILSFAPGYLKAAISNRDNRYITFLQNDYPYWTVKMNGKKISHFTGYRTFISAELPAGDTIVEYRFNPLPIRLFLWLSMLFALGGIVILAHKEWRQRRIFQ